MNKTRIGYTAGLTHTDCRVSRAVSRLEATCYDKIQTFSSYYEITEKGLRRLELLDGLEDNLRPTE